MSICEYLRVFKSILKLVQDYRKKLKIVVDKLIFMWYKNLAF